MTQYLKDDVRERIVSGALEVFARKGFRQATMSEIARAGGVSTGNVYHYYGHKNDLFNEVVSDAFVRRFSRLVRRRTTALHGVADVRALDPGAAYHGASEALLAFAIEDRLRLVVLLGRSEGTRHEGFAVKLQHDLQRQALAYARTIHPRFDATPALCFNLGHIYRHWMVTLVSILDRFDTEAEIRAAVACFSTYHLAGLKSLLT